MDFNFLVGSKIAVLRRAKGLTGERFAELIGVSPQAVSKWENGRNLPESALLPAIAAILDTSIDDLFDVSMIINDKSYGIYRCSGAEIVYTPRFQLELYSNESLPGMSAGNGARLFYNDQNDGVREHYVLLNLYFFRNEPKKLGIFALMNRNAKDGKILWSGIDDEESDEDFYDNGFDAIDTLLPAEIDRLEKVENIKIAPPDFVLPEMNDTDFQRIFQTWRRNGGLFEKSYYSDNFHDRFTEYYFTLSTDTTEYEYYMKVYVGRTPEIKISASVKVVVGQGTVEKGDYFRFHFYKTENGRGKPIYDQCTKLDPDTRKRLIASPFDVGKFDPNRCIESSGDCFCSIKFIDSDTVVLNGRDGAERKYSRYDKAYERYL